MIGAGSRVFKQMAGFYEPHSPRVDTVHSCDGAASAGSHRVMNPVLDTDISWHQYAWPSGVLTLGRQDSGVGNLSNKVNLRRRPVRRSSRFVCEAILEAFERALHTQSFEACTTNHVADLAGVGIGSFYEYFSNKETVLAVWLHRHSSTLLSDFDRLLDEDSPVPLEVKLEMVVRGVFESYARKLKVWRKVSQVVYAVSTKEQCARCAMEYSARWQRLLESYYPDAREIRHKLASTASACHEQLLGHIEWFINYRVNDLAGLVHPQVRQRSVDSLLSTINDALGSPLK